MQDIRTLLRSSLANSLSALSPLDRLGAAWPVAAGHAIAERSRVLALNGATVSIVVPDAGWQKQLRATEGQLCGDLSRISHVPLTDILFLLASPCPEERNNAQSIVRPTF